MRSNPNPKMPCADHDSIEDERAALCCYTLGADIGVRVNKDIFTHGAHGVVFQVIKDLKDEGKEPDLDILVSELEKRGQLDEAGGPANVAAIMNTVGSAVNVEYYEARVLEAYRRRMLWQAFTAGKEAVEAGAPDSVVARHATEAAEAAAAFSGQGGSDRTKPILFSELLKKQFPPKRFFIERILTPGLTVFSGASKSGKSWLALQICQALDAGGGFLGTLRAEKTSALYFSLEDGEEAIFHRLQKQGNTYFVNSYLATEKMTFKELSAFLDRNTHVKIVLVDTWQKFASVADSNDYALNVETAARLKDIADRHETAIIVIAHLRKNQLESGDHLNETLGSIGLVATADCTWTLRRKRGESTARFLCSGRNIEDVEFSLRWDREIASWTITDAGDLKPVLSEAQQNIIDLLASEARNWTTAEIAEALSKGKSAVSNLLKKLLDGGYIESPYYGQYRSFTVSLPLRKSETVKLPEPSGAAVIPFPAASAGEPVS